MKKVTVDFTKNTYHRSDEEKVTVKVASGTHQGEVMKAFETCSTVANKLVNDLDKAGFKGATTDIAFIKAAFGYISIQNIVRIPCKNHDLETVNNLQKVLKTIEQWANS